jgi:hypothetical protein
VRITDLPVTAQRLVRALGDAGTMGSG